jgi:hypothetical protein
VRREETTTRRAKDTEEPSNIQGEGKERGEGGREQRQGGVVTTSVIAFPVYPFHVPDRTL